MKNYLPLFLIVLGFFSCTTKDPFQPPVFKTVDVLGCTDSTLYLSELTDTIRYLVLDIPEKYAAPMEGVGIPSVYITGKYILYKAKFPNQQDIFYNEKCLVYNQSDRTLTGVFGEGKEWNVFYPKTADIRHGFYSESHVQVDETGQYLYMPTGIKKEGETSYRGVFTKWDLATLEVVDMIPIKGNAYYCSYLGGNIYFQYVLNYKGNEEDRGLFLDAKGDIKKHIPQTKRFKIKNQFGGASGGEFTTYVNKGNFYYYDIHMNTVYMVTPDMNEYPAFTFRLGERKLPYYYSLQTKQSELDWSKYISIQNVLGSGDYLFFKYPDKGRWHYAVYDALAEHTISLTCGYYFTEYYTENGIPNDIDGGLPFWPQSVSRNGEVACCYPADSLRAFLNEPKDYPIRQPEATTRLRALLEEAPPHAMIVAVVKLNK